MLKSRRTFPPGQWMFFQAETGWPHDPNELKGLDFNQVVDRIIAMRVKNPRFNLSTDWTSVANELDAYTCARLNNSPHYCLTAEVQSFSQGLASSPRLPGPVQAAVGAVVKYAQNTAAGIGVYVEWFGDGKPVPKEEAESRASVCVQCPKNVRGNVMQRFNAAVGRRLMQAFSILNDLDLRTSRDEELGVCEPCDCPLRAKVWSPLQVIKDHITPEAVANLWDRCWITK